jgi:preprotein translocase subunit SecB
MRAAQISLTNYFVSELQFKANQAFDPEKSTLIGIDDLKVTDDVKPKTESRRNWQITLRIAVGENCDRNFLCSFVIEIVGSIDVDQSVKDENIERLVYINGKALLFSAAREILRAVTSRGPSRSVLLPTVTFWEPKAEPINMPPATSAESGKKPEILVDEKAT